MQRIFPNLSNKIDEFSGRTGKLKDAEEAQETLEWGNEELTQDSTRETVFVEQVHGYS